MDALKGNRTYIVASILGALGTVMASTDWIAFLSDPKAGAMTILSAALMAVMRSITSTPPGRKA